MSVKIFFEIGHVAAVKSRPTAEGYTHDWELFVRGLDGNDISHFIDKVVFNLHESFPKPKRVFKELPYLVKEAGYAGFILPVEIYFKNRDEPKKAVYNYDLDLTPVKNQREEYIFHSPSDEFRRKLLKGGGFILTGGSGPANNPSTNDYKGIRGAHVAPAGVERPSSSSSSQEKKSKSKSSTVDDTKGQFAELFGSPFPHKTSGIGSSSKVSPDPKQPSSGSAARKTSPPVGSGGTSTGKSTQKVPTDSRSIPNSSSSMNSKDSSKDKSSSSSSKHKHSNPNKESKKSSSNSISSSAGSGMVEEKHSKDKKDKSHSKERDKTGKEKTVNSSNSGAAGNSTQTLSASGTSVPAAVPMKRPAQGNTVATSNSNSSGSISNSNNSNNPTVPTGGSSSLSIGSSSAAQSGGSKTSDSGGSAGQKRSTSEKEKKSSKKEKKSYEKDKERTSDPASSAQRKAERSGETKGQALPTSSASGQQVAFSKGDVPSAGSTKASSASSSGNKMNSTHPPNEGQMIKDGSVKSSASTNTNASTATAAYMKEKRVNSSGESVSSKTDQTTNSGTGTVPSTKASEKMDKSDRDGKDEARKHKHKKKDKSKDKEKDRASTGKEKKDRKEKDKSVAIGNTGKVGSFSNPTPEANDVVPPKATKQQIGGSESSTKQTGHDRDKALPGFSGAASRQQQQTSVKSVLPVAALIGEISGEEHSNDSDGPTGDSGSRAPSTNANEKDSEASNGSIADMLGNNAVTTAQQRPPSATSSSTTTSSVREPMEKYHHHKSKKDKASSRGQANTASSLAQPSTSPVVADAKENTISASANSVAEPVKKRKRKNKDSETVEKVVKDAVPTDLATGTNARERRSVSPPSPPAASSGNGSGSSLMEPPAKVPKKDDPYGGAPGGKANATDTADHTFNNNNNNNNNFKQSAASGAGGGSGAVVGEENNGSSSCYGAGNAPTATGSSVVAGGGAATSLTGDYMSELKDLQHKIMTLQDNSELQRVVEMIAATGCYEITSATFDFDLCALDRLTVQRLQDFFATS